MDLEGLKWRLRGREAVGDSRVHTIQPQLFQRSLFGLKGLQVQGLQLFLQQCALIGSSSHSVF